MHINIIWGVFFSHFHSFQIKLFLWWLTINILQCLLEKIEDLDFFFFNNAPFFWGVFFKFFFTPNSIILCVMIDSWVPKHLAMSFKRKQKVLYKNKIMCLHFMFVAEWILVFYEICQMNVQRILLWTGQGHLHFVGFFLIDISMGIF